MNKNTIGRMSLVSLYDGVYHDVAAKNDTGAHTSSIWASDISVTAGGTLSFCLFGEGSVHYTGERIAMDDYTVRVVRSSNGEEQVRYSVFLPITMEGQSFNAEFTLTNRGKNRFPILIGARLLSGHFVVDVEHRIEEYRSYVKDADNDADEDPDVRLEELREFARTHPELFHEQHHSGE